MSVFKPGDLVFVYMDHRLDRVSVVERVEASYVYVDGAPYVGAFHKGGAHLFRIEKATDAEIDEYIRHIKLLPSNHNRVSEDGISDWVRNYMLDRVHQARVKSAEIKRSEGEMCQGVDV